MQNGRQRKTKTCRQKGIPVAKQTHMDPDWGRHTCIWTGRQRETNDTQADRGATDQRSQTGTKQTGRQRGTQADRVAQCSAQCYRQAGSAD